MTKKGWKKVFARANKISKKRNRQTLLDEFDEEKSDESWGFLYTMYRYLKGE